MVCSQTMICKHIMPGIRVFLGRSCSGCKYMHPSTHNKFIFIKPAPAMSFSAKPFMPSVGFLRVYGSLRSFLYNVRNMSFCVIFPYWVVTTQKDPLTRVTPSEPDNGSFRKSPFTGNSRLDFPGMGLVWNRFTLHTMRFL